MVKILIIVSTRQTCVPMVNASTLLEASDVLAITVLSQEDPSKPVSMSTNALLHNLLAVLIAETHQVVSSAYVLKDTNLIVMAKDVLILMNVLQKLIIVSTSVSTLSVHSSVTAHEDSSKREQNVLTEMNAENNRASVVEEAVSAKTIQAVTIVNAHEDTEWMSEEASVLISMNVVVVLLLVHVEETAKTYPDLSDATADKDSLQQCLDVAVLMLMNALVVAETHVDPTNNVKILREASSVVARVDSVWDHKEAVAVM